MVGIAIKAVKLVVRGRVQRVGFRRYALDVAQKLGLVGYVRNLPDGSVEVFAQGERGLIERLVERVRSPPPPAVVEELSVEEATPKPELRVFRIEFGSLSEELQEGFGAMQSVFMEYWREFRDYRREFKDYRSEFKDYRQEFGDYREEFREFARRTDENFRFLMEKYGEISEKLTVILETLVKVSKEGGERLAKAVGKLTEAVETLKQAVEK